MTVLVIGRVGDGRRWVGVQSEDQVYDKLTGGLSGDTTHVLIVGDDDDLRALAEMIFEELGLVYEVWEDSP